MTLATTVLPPPSSAGRWQSAKLLAAIHELSGGRLVAGLGPGSSARDYEAGRRAVRGALAALRRRDRSAAVALGRRPAGRDAAALWIASWGSPAGLRRVARLGDGWLASGYNTTPERVRRVPRQRSPARSGAGGRGAFPNAIATMWLYVTEGPRGGRAGCSPACSPRCSAASVEAAARAGPADRAAEQTARRRISAFQDGGSRADLVWPLADELEQLERSSQGRRAARSRGLGDRLERPCLAIMRRMPPLRARERAPASGQRLCVHRFARSTPLSIHDAAHVRNALARFGQVAFEDEAARDRARNRLLRAAKKHGIMPIGFISSQLEPQRKLPKGNLTFLLTDIEGSTELLGRLDDGYAPLSSPTSGVW